MEKYRYTVNNIPVNPYFNDDMSLVYEKESGYNFFRSKLSNGVSFLGFDFDLLVSQDIETEFVFKIERYYEDDKVWELYFVGKFYKTDGKWNYNDKKVTISITPKDAYDDILAGLDKEFSLVKITNQKSVVSYERKGALQVYVEGADTITNIYENIHSEQKVNRACWKNELVNDLGFYPSSIMSETVITVKSYNGSNEISEGCYIGKTIEGGRGSIYYREDNKYYIKLIGVDSYSNQGSYEIFDSQSGERVSWFITMGVTVDTHVGLGIYNNIGSGGYNRGPYCIIKTKFAYCRVVTNLETLGSNHVKQRPENDIVNCVYNKMVAYTYDAEPIIGLELSDSKTIHGKQPDGDKYYVKPNIVNKVLFPLDRSSWSDLSYWVAMDTEEVERLKELSQSAKLQDGYKLSTVINELLNNISQLKEEVPSQIITHDATPECSQFLYGEHNLFSQKLRNPTLLITQKTNMFKDYDNGATKTPITLGEILKMLKVCYDCDWFIQDGKLIIEHSEFFKRGGTYENSTNLIDLTRMIYAKNNKSWAYGASSIEYDKVQMPERYKFKWHDEVSPIFNGYEVEVQSRFVSRGKTEEYSAGNFTSDINHILLDIGNISKDGYVLIAADEQSNNEGKQVYKVSQTYKDILSGEYVALQNGDLSFSNLLNYLTFNMPSRNITVNGMTREANGTLYGRTSTVKFPVVAGLTTTSRIKTSIGIGIIEKFSVNLCSDMVTATIKYDTYE